MTVFVLMASMSDATEEVTDIIFTEDRKDHEDNPLDGKPTPGATSSLSEAVEGQQMPPLTNVPE